MRAALVVLVLLIFAAAGWWLLARETETPLVAEQAGAQVEKRAPDLAPPERSSVAAKEHPAPDALPDRNQPPPTLPRPLPGPERCLVELTVRNLVKLTAVPAFRWRFRGEGAEQHGEGAEGRASLDLPTAALGELLVEAAGYTPFVRPQFAVPPEGRAPATVDVLLTPTVVAAGITLFVHDTALQPIANVRVDAYVLTAESRETAWHLGKALWARRTAAADGRYTLPPLPAGEYGIRVTAADADGNPQPLLPYSRTFVLTGDNGYVEDVTLEPGNLPVFDLVDNAGAFLDPQQLGAVTLSLRLPGAPDVPRMWVVTGNLATAAAIGALPGVGPVRPAEALPAGTYSFEVLVAGKLRLQQSLNLRAGERQQERFIVP